MADGVGARGIDLSRKGVWNDVTVEALKKHWADGFSASQIAAVLWRDHRVSVTRNSVIGKVHRLGLTGRAEPSAPMRAYTPRAKPKTYAPADPVAAATQSRQRQSTETQRVTTKLRHTHSPVVDVPKSSVVVTAGRANMTVAAIDGSEPVGLLDLADGQCRMIVSELDAAVSLYCGCACERDRRGRFKSWCPSHRAVVVSAASGTRRVNTKGIPMDRAAPKPWGAERLGRRFGDY